MSVCPSLALPPLAAARCHSSWLLHLAVLLPGEARPGRDRRTLSRPSCAAALPAEEAAPAHCKRSVLTSSLQRPPKGRVLGIAGLVAAKDQLG